MLAVILVGGYGTRLRPLTLSVPKPLIPLGSQSILEHQLEALSECGVKGVVVATAYHASRFHELAPSLEKQYGIKVVCSQETEHLGTGGALANAAQKRYELAAELGLKECPTIVLNCDIICRYPFEQLIAAHGENTAACTCVVTPVENAAMFGTVIFDQDTLKVSEFVEKSVIFRGKWINAGMYIMSHALLERLPSGAFSLEKEVFPRLATTGEMHCIKYEDYWIDVGTPEDYMGAVKWALSSGWLKSKRPRGAAKSTSMAKQPGYVSERGATLVPLDKPGVAFMGAVEIGAGSKVGHDSLIGPNVWIQSGVTIGQGCRLKDCIILSGATIGDSSYIANSIVGWRTRIGRWCHVAGPTITGESVEVADECILVGARVLPNSVVRESMMTRGTVLM